MSSDNDKAISLLKNLMSHDLVEYNPEEGSMCFFCGGRFVGDPFGDQALAHRDDCIVPEIEKYLKEKSEC